MTEGQIWAVMLKKKVFTPFTVLAEFKPNPVIKQYLKEKIRNMIVGQLKLGILKQVNDDPPVYATLDATEEDFKKLQRKCLSCGKTFYPKQPTQEFCSPECRETHYKQYHEKRRKRAGMRVGSRRRWTPEEERELLKLKEYGYTYAEIAEKLGRTQTSVIEKYKELKGVRK